MTESGQIVALAKKWIDQRANHGSPEYDQPRVVGGFARRALSKKREPPYRWAITQSELVSLAVTVHRLLSSNMTSQALLNEASELFDRAANGIWPADEFGERYEICFSLAFVAWRQSSRLGLECDSQAWLRIADLLATESFAAAESLAYFLYLDDHEKTTALTARLLDSPEDVFLALAIVRRDRNRSTQRCFQAVGWIYRWLSGSSISRLFPLENAYFLGEAAFLAGLTAEALGLRVEVVKWLTVAEKEFEGASAKAPLNGKVQLLRAMRARDLKRFDDCVRSFTALRPRLTAWGMYRESLLCKLAIALVWKELGLREKALAPLLELEHETENVDPSLYSCVLSHAAQILDSEGQERQAIGMLNKALFAAGSAGNPRVAAVAASCRGEAELDRGNREAAVDWFFTAVALSESGGSSSDLGYFRVYLAEALIATGRLEEARKQLILALPVIQRENMIPEGIHALKLLGVVAASCDAKDGLRDLLIDMERRFGRG